MSKAIIGACLQVTVLACESWVACANSIVAMLVVSATPLTSLQRAVDSHESLVANAGPVSASTMSRALIGAGADGAVSSGEAELAIASSIVANTSA